MNNHTKTMISLHQTKYKILKSATWFFWKLIFPFAIIKVRIIQYRYKRITEKNIESNQSNMVLSKLRFLLSKEQYMEDRFNPWGVYHPSCVLSKRYNRFLAWLFPLKDFKEIKLVVWYNPKAVNWYKNEIYALTGSSRPVYEKEIMEQLKIWWNNKHSNKFWR